jgi:large subunit ribosomal protein L11
MKEQISALVDGGEASGGPPLGPSLGPLGVNITAVINAINERTKDFKGMKVPVKVIVDPSTKDFEIEVGTPPTSALIKKELGIEKGSGEPRTTVVGDLSLEAAVKIARMKRASMLAASLKSAVMEVLGACVSMGITIEGKPAKEAQREIAAGTHDEILKE